jgi:hypothetical protein
MENQKSNNTDLKDRLLSSIPFISLLFLLVGTMSSFLCPEMDFYIKNSLWGSCLFFIAVVGHKILAKPLGYKPEYEFFALIALLFLMFTALLEFFSLFPTDSPNPDISLLELFRYLPIFVASGAVLYALACPFSERATDENEADKKTPV